MSDHTTINQDEIRAWVEAHDGSPALNDTGLGRGRLAINFGDEKEYEPLSWDEFFDHFESLNLAFQFDPDIKPNDGDEFSYSFIDRRLIPSEAEDDDNAIGFPESELPPENINPSASSDPNSPDNMGGNPIGAEDDIMDELTLEE